MTYLSKEEKEMLLQLVNQSGFKGEIAESVVRVKAVLSSESADKWQHACMNALPPDEYSRIKSIVDSTP